MAKEQSRTEKVLGTVHLLQVNSFNSSMRSDRFQKVFGETLNSLEIWEDIQLFELKLFVLVVYFVPLFIIRRLIRPITTKIYLKFKEIK